jgi:hypothetical protein
MVEQWIGNKQNDGDGGPRPMPRAAEDAAPPPAIGLNGQNVSEQVAESRRQPGEGAERAEAPAPGFSIQ